MSPSLRPRERFLLTIGGGVVAAILIVLLVFFPQIQEVAAARRDARRKQAELAQATALAQQSTEIEQKYAAVRQEAEALLARIPADPDLPDLIIRLDQAMETSRVGLLQITFLNESPPPTAAQGGTEGNVGSLPIQLRVRGTYPQLRALVQALEDSPRLVVVDRMAMTGAETGIVTELALRALFLR